MKRPALINSAKLRNSSSRLKSSAATARTRRKICGRENSSAPSTKDVYAAAASSRSRSSDAPILSANSANDPDARGSDASSLRAATRHGTTGVSRRASCAPSSTSTRCAATSFRGAGRGRSVRDVVERTTGRGRGFADAAGLTASDRSLRNAFSTSCPSSSGSPTCRAASLAATAALSCEIASWRRLPSGSCICASVSFIKRSKAASSTSASVDIKSVAPTWFTCGSSSLGVS